MLDGCVYAVAGWAGEERLATVEKYCPESNKWSFVPPLGMACTSPAVAAYEGKLYVTGKCENKMNFVKQTDSHRL